VTTLPAVIRPNDQIRRLVARIAPAPTPQTPQPVTFTALPFVGLNINSPVLALLGGVATRQPLRGDKFRYLGPITALMTITENATERLTITQHPVAIGAQITDHAYREPSQLNLQMMATNSVPGAGATFVQQVYDQLITLQRSLAPIKVQTGKRLYESMLIASINLATDQTSENALVLSITCQEIITVPTSTVAMPANVAEQGMPAKTNPVSQGGVKQATPAGNVTVPAVPF
jgi:Dit-like tail protein